jgi:hypothetical protein
MNAAIRTVTLGEGKWLAGTLISDGMPALCFGPAPDQREPGTIPTAEAAIFATQNGAVVIRFTSPDAMTRMLDLMKQLADEIVKAQAEATP